MTDDTWHAKKHAAYGIQQDVGWQGADGMGEGAGGGGMVGVCGGGAPSNKQHDMRTNNNTREYTFMLLCSKLITTAHPLLTAITLYHLDPRDLCECSQPA